MTEWTSSLGTLFRLREAGLTGPEVSMLLWAEAGQLRARAKWGRFDGCRDEEFHDKSEPDDAPWPAIPRDFWRWVRAQGEAHHEAGVFAATVVYDPEIGSYSETEHIQLFGVEFSEQDVTDLLTGCGRVHSSPPLSPASASKAGRKRDLERWNEFAAALAFVGRTAGDKTFSGQSSIYEAVAGALTASGREPLDQRGVRQLLRLAHAWAEADVIPQKQP